MSIAAASLAGSLLLEGRLFCILMSACLGAGLRGGSERTWLLEFLHSLPPKLVCHVPWVPVTHRSLSLLGASACVVCFCLEGASPPPPRENSYSSFRTHVKCHLLQEAFLDAPRLGLMALLCSPTLLSFHHGMSAVVACSCYSMLCFPVCLLD